MASDTKVWFITGASRGLGRELALAVLARGAVVIGTSRDGTLDIEGHGGTLHPLALDLSKPGREREVVDRAQQLHGRLDVLVNNAGFGLLAAVEEADQDEVARTFEVNFFGPLRLIQAALPHMRVQKRGHIVNVSSIAGIAPGAGSGIYAAAKFALGGMSESLAQELTPLGIKVTVVEPGAFRTDFLTDRSIRVPEPRIADYAPTAGKMVQYLAEMNGKQVGDPARGAAAIVEAVNSPEPPMHLLLGSDALKRARAKHQFTGEERDRWERVTLGTDFPA